MSCRQYFSRHYLSRQGTKNACTCTPRPYTAASFASLLLCAVNKSTAATDALPAMSCFLVPPWRYREHLKAVCYKAGIIMCLVLLKSSSSSIVFRVLDVVCRDIKPGKAGSTAAQPARRRRRRQQICSVRNLFVLLILVGILGTMIFLYSKVQPQVL